MGCSVCSSNLVLTGDVSDLGQIGDGRGDAHVHVHVDVGDERVPLPVLSGEVELLPQEASHVRVTFMTQDQRRPPNAEE